MTKLFYPKIALTGQSYLPQTKSDFFYLYIFLYHCSLIWVSKRPAIRLINRKFGGLSRSKT